MHALFPPRALCKSLYRNLGNPIEALLSFTGELDDCDPLETMASADVEKMGEERACDACGTSREGLKRCKQCQSVYCNCNAQCQRNHWPEHKADCTAKASKTPQNGSVKSPEIKPSQQQNGQAKLPQMKPAKPRNGNGKSPQMKPSQPQEEVKSIDSASNLEAASSGASHTTKAAKVESSDDSTSLKMDVVEESVSEADQILNNGLDLQRADDYEGAFRTLTLGVTKFPTHYKLREARALAAMLTGRLDVAEKDAQEAVKLDSKSLKAKIRLLKILVKKGSLERAIQIAEQVLAEDPTNASARQDLQHARLNQRRMEAAKAAYKEGKFRDAAALTFKVGDESPGSREALLLRAESLYGMSEMDEAFSITTGILRDDEKEGTRDHALLNLRAKILFAQERLDQCMKHLQQVLQENPDDSAAAKLLKKVKKIQRLKSEGDEHFKGGRYQESYDSYSSCLDETAGSGGLAQFRAKVFCNRAGALSMLGRHEEALLDCDQAIELDDRYIKAYTRRATSLRALGGKERLERAVSDYEKIEQLQGEPTAESRENIKQAKRELKMAKRKDYYALLGLNQSDADNLTTDDFKKAYKKMALKYHPDRHTNSSEEEKKKAEATFKDVSEALNVLSDPQKKRLYDRGMDLEEIEQYAASGGGGGYGYGGGGFHHHGYDDVDPDMFGGNPFMGGGGFGGGFGGRGGFRYGGGYPY